MLRRNSKYVKPEFHKYEEPGFSPSHDYLKHAVGEFQHRGGKIRKIKKVLCEPKPLKTKTVRINSIMYM